MTKKGPKPSKKAPKKVELQGQAFKPALGRANQTPYDVLDEPIPPQIEKTPTLVEAAEPLVRPSIDSGPAYEQRLRFFDQETALCAREQRVYEAAQETLSTIKSEILDTLFLEPEVPVFRFEFNNLPSDVIALVVDAVAANGFNSHYHDGKLEILLPVVRPVAVLPEHRVSAVRPL